MDIRISHTQTQEEAKRRIECLIQRLKAKYSSQITNLEEYWLEYTGKIKGSAKGYSVSGTLEISPDSVTVNLKIPFVLRIFSTKIRDAVETQLRNTLS